MPCLTRRSSSSRRGKLWLFVSKMHFVTSSLKILTWKRFCIIRDGWEDHYRLFEALVSGACVFQDYMIGLPHGLENGTSIVMFRNPSELESLLSYYLSHEEERQAIARGGRDVAMSHHRSWHRLEQLVFGKALSSCSNLKAMGANATECPYFSRFY